MRKDIPNGNTQALFMSLVQGKPFGQNTLLALESTLLDYCIQLTPPNAVGDRTKIGDPISKRWTRVGFGEGHWVWIPQTDVYEPVCSDEPGPTPVPDLSAIVQRLDALERQVQLLIVNLGQGLTENQALANRAIGIAMSAKVKAEAVESVNADQSNRLTTLEQRKVPTGASASLFGYPIPVRFTY